MRPSLALLVFLHASALWAQGSGGPVISDSKVGYIDPAIPGNVARFRYDSAWQSPFTSRAEFLYAKTGPDGPGLPRPERSNDFQDLSAYLEVAVGPSASVFFEAPVRFLNPEINDNFSGLGDMNLGFKVAFWQDACTVGSFQFRTYLPTGDAGHGLGTHHVSLEPAFLGYHKLSDRLALEGEFRAWIPVDGTDFAGNILRYGVGASWTAWQTEQYWLAPVAEFVGWTVLDGQKAFVNDAGAAFVQDAAGDTIFNIKLGLRFGMANGLNFYTGYGRPVTGDRWYDHVLRAEIRWNY